MDFTVKFTEYIYNKLCKFTFFNMITDMISNFSSKYEKVGKFHGLIMKIIYIAMVKKGCNQNK